MIFSSNSDKCINVKLLLTSSKNPGPVHFYKSIFNIQCLNKLFRSSKENQSYHYNITRSVLDDTEQAQDDHNDVKEVDHDGSPLVAKEVEHLPLQRSYLGWGVNRGRNMSL